MEVMVQPFIFLLLSYLKTITKIGSMSIKVKAVIKIYKSRFV